MEKDIKTMLRQDVIDGLRKHSDPATFMAIVELPTPHLKALLMFYEAGGESEKVEVGSEGKLSKLNLEMKILEGGLVDESMLVSEVKLNMQQSQKQMFFLRLFSNVISKKND